MGLVLSIVTFFSDFFGAKERKFKPLPGITLYDNEQSPCARRVRMTLLEKDIVYRKVAIDLMKGEQLSSEYERVCANKKVPAIGFLDVPGVEDCSLFESNVITEFLDAEMFPGPKLYPVNLWERAQVKMWQDWELGLVDNFVPFVYSNALPFVLQLQHSSKESFLASLPADTAPAKRQYWTRIYDRAAYSDSELKDHGIACYQHLFALEKALEGKKYLVGDCFSAADLSVLPRVSMYYTVGLDIPKSQFPNIVDYLARLGGRRSIRQSVSLGSRVMMKFMASCPGLLVKLGNWRSGRQLTRLDGLSSCLKPAMNRPPVDRADNPEWTSAVDKASWDTFVVADCALCPECWQVKLLLQEKGLKYTAYKLQPYDVVGHWAGSGGFIRIHHNGREVVGIRAVLDYVDACFGANKPRFFPEVALDKARVQCWQAWDQTLGYSELAPLLEMTLVSKALLARYGQDLQQLYSLSGDPQYGSKFPSILQCLVYGLMAEEADSDTLAKVKSDHRQVVSQAAEVRQSRSQLEELLQDRLKHLDTKLKNPSNTSFIVGESVTAADITVFCRLCFCVGLGLLRPGKHEAVVQWFEQLKETRPHFLALSREIADLFNKS